MTVSGGATQFDAPRFSVAAALADPQRGAAEAAARRRDAGYAHGYQAGLERAQADVDRAIADHRRSAQRLGELSDALAAAVSDLALRDRVAMTDIEEDVVALAVALATEIVGRELRSIDDAVVVAMARVAGLVPDRGRPVVRVHPDDAATAQEAVDADLVHLSAEVDVIADPHVEHGGCVVEVGACRIDGQLGPAIDRMRAAFGGDDDDLLARAGEPEQSVP